MITHPTTKPLKDPEKRWRRFELIDGELFAELYARFAIADYWVVHPDADRVEVYRLADGAYAKPRILEPGEQLVNDLVPGLTIDIGELLAF